MSKSRSNKVPTGITLKEQQRDPEGTTRALHVKDMFSVTAAIDFSYHVGVPNEQTGTITITNYNHSVALKVRMILPEFVTIDTPLEFISEPNTTTTLKARMNESAVRGMVLSKGRNFKELVKAKAEPLNVTGPVYVYTNKKPKS